MRTQLFYACGDGSFENFESFVDIIRDDSFRSSCEDRFFFYLKVLKWLLTRDDWRLIIKLCLLYRFLSFFQSPSMAHLSIPSKRSIYTYLSSLVFFSFSFFFAFFSLTLLQTVGSPLSDFCRQPRIILHRLEYLLGCQQEFVVLIFLLGFRIRSTDWRQ